MSQYQILYWKDIPAQIKVYEGRRAISRQLPERFQIEIDRLATKEGLTGTDDYLDQWQWSRKKDRPGNAEEILDSLELELQKEFDSQLEGK